MELKNYNIYFFILVLCAISVVTYFIFQPFLIAILLAAILATLFHGTYQFFLRITGQHKNTSSLITSLIILLVIVIPFVTAVFFVGSELVAAFNSLSNSEDVYRQYVQPAVMKLQEFPALDAFNLQYALSKESFMRYFGESGQTILALLQSAYVGTAHVFFMVFVVFFSLYYFLKDGKSIVSRIMYISPLRDTHEKMLINKFISMSKATIKGSLLLGILQGVLGGIAFAIAGIPSVLTWTLAMAVLSLIPLFGSAIVWFPVGIVMLLLGHIWQGIFILLFGIGVISVLDNLLRPKLVGNDTQMHPLIVLFATLGGISLFGFFGFIIGPIIVALFLTLWDIYAVEFKKQLKKYNK